MSKKPDKKMTRVEDRLCLTLEDFEGSIGDLIGKLQGWQARGHNHLELDSWSDPPFIESFVFRPETDEEFDARVQKWQEQQRQAREYKKEQRIKKEQQERAMYERLHKKYAGKPE
jgi:hypothetical protein